MAGSATSTEAGQRRGNTRDSTTTASSPNHAVPMIIGHSMMRGRYMLSNGSPECHPGCRTIHKVAIIAQPSSMTGGRHVATASLIDRGDQFGLQARVGVA